MKKNYYILLLVLSSLFSFSQTIGDFRSKATGPNIWNDATSWETWNGGWIPATSYPGQNAGTYTVTIQATHTITIASDLVTNEMGTIILNGELDLNPPNPYIITLSTLDLLIDGGSLNYLGPQVNFKLPLRLSPSPSPIIEIKNSGKIIGSCTHNDEISIGNQIYAVCKSTGSSDYVTFGEITASGGTINATITLPTITSSCKNQPITLEGHYGGAAGSTVNYEWIATDPNGASTSISSGTLANNSDVSTTSFTPTLFGDYLISFTVSTIVGGLNFSNTMSAVVIVEDVTPPVTPILADVNVGQCSGTPTAPTTTDICAGTITGTTTTTFPITTQGATVVTWTFADGNGNSTTANQNVIVDDTTKPTLTAIANRNENIGASCSFSIPDYTNLTTAADNCTAVGSIVKTQSPVAGTVLSGHNTTQLITITANDGNGNTETTSFTITLKDVTPSATPTLAAVNVGQCSGTPTAPTTTDICAGTITGTTTTTFPITTQGTTVVTWTFADGNGNSTTANQNVTVLDTTKPTLTAIANRNENIGASCNFSIPDYTNLTTAADNCTAAGSIVKTQSPIAGTVISGHNTTQLITITANDGNGNTETTSFTITLKDVTPPVTPTLAAVNVGQCSGTPTAPTTTDICAGTITGTTTTTFPITTQGTTVVTWTFADGNGNSTTANQNVTVLDTTKPTLTAIANRNENIGTSCSFSIPDYTSLTTAADNCTAAGSIVKTQSPIAGTAISGHNTNQLITITANDGNGNTETISFTITLKDVTPPVTPTLAAVNVGQCSGTPTAPTTTDICAGSITGTTTTTFPITTQGTTVVTWTFADGNGNLTTANQNVTVLDTTKPTLTAIANRNENIEASCSFSIPDYTSLTTASDNCTAVGSIVKTQSPAAGTVISGHNTTQLITITANDGNGNTETTTFTITLKDVTPPVTPTLAAVNVGQCSGTPTAPTTTDICAGTITGTTTTTFPITTQGTTVVTWTFADGNGNSTTANQNVTVLDTTKPTLTAIANRNENIGTSCSFSIPDYTSLTTAADNCTAAGSIVKTQSPIAGTVISGHNTTQLITLTANDGNGNTETTSFTITLKDVTPPVTPTLADVNVGQCSGTPTTPTTTDICAGTITGTTTTTFPITTQGTTVVTWTFADGNGNSTTANQNVTVLDTTKPTLTAIANRNENIGASCSFSIPDYTSLTTAADNCTAVGSIVKTQSPIAGTVISGHNTTQLITITANDGNGNTETTSFTITLKDVTPPVIPTLTAISVNADAGVCTYASSQLTAPSASDNCTTVTVTRSPATLAKGINTVTWTATDAAGLTATSTQSVTVIDNQAPTIATLTAISVNADAGVCTYASSQLTAPSASDNCTTVTVTRSPATLAKGLNTVTWTATDTAGLTATSTQSVTVIDNQAPTIATLTAISVNADAGVCTYASSQLTAPSASDNCTTITVTRSPATLAKGLNTVTWTATDTAGLTATSTQSVTVIDNQVPTITCPANKTANTNADGTGNCTTTVALGTPTATDNCTTTGNFTFIAKVGGSVINPATYLFGTGTTTVVWTATDLAGNVSASCNQTVTVTDNEAPSITCPANITTAKTSNDGTGNCTTTVALGIPTVSDNCTAVGSLVVTNNAPVNFPIGLTVVTWTVKDAANNTTTCTQNVTVTDDENPTITAPANITTTTDIACTATGVVLGTPITADNCSVASVTNNHASTTYPLGTTTVIWTVTDGSGRTATANQTVTVKDTTNPTLTQGANQSAFTAVGTCNASVAIIDAGFADNCSVSSIAYTLSGATVKGLTAGQVGTYIFNKGITTITYTVSDTATPPNTFNGSKTVTVTDNVKPVAPSLPVINAQCSITVPFPVATDNCDGFVTATTSDNRTFTSQGNFSIIWSFKDSSNNETIATQNVVIKDTTTPVPSIGTLPASSFTNCSIDSLTPPTANDNCTGTITGTTTTSFPITTFGTTVITWTYNDGNGNTSTQTQNITLTKPAISGGNLLGYVSGLSPAATPSQSVAINSCPDNINPVTINLSGQTGTIVRWEKFEAGSSSWSVIANTSNSYDIVFDYANTKSTLFRVLVQVGNCTVYSNMVNVHAVPPDVPPILDQNYFNICLNSSVSLVARNGYTSTANVSNGGDYNTGQFPNKWDPTQWKIDGEVAGTTWTAAANDRKYNNWSGTNNHPVGTLYRIEYDSQDLKFGIAHGNYNSAGYISDFGVGPTTLETPIFSLVGLKTASIDFDQAYNLHAGDICKLELSLDGGATYTVTLQNLIGTSPHALSWGDTHGAPVPYPYVAPGTNGKPSTLFNFKNDNSSFDVSQYIGNDNVRVKWTFFGTTDESAWAIDNITIPVKPYFDDVEWTDGLGNPGEYIIRNKLEATYTFVPTAPGVHQYGATSLINGCRAYDVAGTALATVVVNYAYAGSAQAYTQAECGKKTVTLNAYDNTKSADENKINGAYTLATNSFSNDPGTGATGRWSVVSGPNTCSTPVFSNINSPTSTFSGDAGVYTLRWKLTASGCYSDVQITLTDCSVVDFDGSNDYVDFNNNYNLGNAFSIETWIKPNAQPVNPPSNIQTIISKRDANNLSNGYDLRLVGSTLSFNWNNGSQLTSPFPLTTSRWYQVAVTYTGGVYRLYVDGIEVNNTSGTAPTTNTLKCLVGAMDQTGSLPNDPKNYFSGWIDEIRIWGVGLSPDHIRQMMNQQIISNGTAVRGEIIPIDINGSDANQDGIDDQPLSWSNLNGYYRMDNISCGYLKPYGGKGVDGKLRNINSSEPQTAPLPYISIRDGNWMDRTASTPWKYGDTVWDYPNSTGYNGTPIDWNIVQTSHNINSGDKDITLLGLLSTAGKLTIADPTVTSPIEKNDGQALWITHYLKLNGNIDLVGESQLLERRYGIYNSSDVFITSQFSESILDVSSSGFIKRDQQGQKNSYNYNYWTSPVSTIQSVSNNTPYIIKNVLKDGTNSALPKTINFGTTFDFADSALSSPIKITDRWIWSYNSQIVSGADLDNYNQWNHITSSGSLKVGEAYTMKGTGGVYPITDTQNYSFIGKPNSGTISLNLTKDNSYLVGNPYPSALDADEFIKDNLKDCLGCRATVNKFSGALYFWDHFGLSNNHNLAEYEGGYATYTLMGGVVGINTSPLTLNNDANGLNKPKRYIPIAQGFFIDGYLDNEVSGPQIPIVVDGGTIIFKNNQRAFKRENPTSSVFMKTRAPKTAIATKSKIRLGFNSSVGAHRQLLVGADPNTTNQFDIGYDALMYDTNENDMFWKMNDSQFVIQAVPDFNTSRIIPIGLVVANEGEVTIKIDELEDVPSSTQIYLHDNETGIYQDLKNSNFTTTLVAGNYDNRFSLTFESHKTASTLNVVENESNDGIIVLYSNNYKTLIIKNNIPNSTVNSASLYNILGQDISNWDLKDMQQTNIQIPIKNISSGIYIVKIKTSKGESSKKIMVN